MTTTTKVDLLLADDHPLYRKGLLETIRRYPYIGNIYEADNGMEALLCLNKHPIDIVFLDCSMPLMNGIACLPRIREQFPDVKVIALSMYNDHSIVTNMIENGAHGYLLKDKGGEMIHHAIRAVLRGRRYFDADVQQIIDPATEKIAVPSPDSNAEKLSEREREVLHHIALGRSPKEIAGKLNISLSTLSIHRTSGLRKINGESNLDITRYYLKSGWISMKEFLGEETE